MRKAVQVEATGVIVRTSEDDVARLQSVADMRRVNPAVHRPNLDVEPHPSHLAHHDVDLGYRVVDVIPGRAVQAVQVGVLNHVLVDDDDTSHTKTNEKLDHRAAGTAAADYGNGELFEDAVDLGPEGQCLSGKGFRGCRHFSRLNLDPGANDSYAMTGPRDGLVFPDPRPVEAVADLHDAHQARPGAVPVLSHSEEVALVAIILGRESVEATRVTVNDCRHQALFRRPAANLALSEALFVEPR